MDLQVVDDYYVLDKERISTPATAINECKYERLEGILEDKKKGNMLAVKFFSYNECELLCDNNKKCMNFEYCPQLKMCRIFDAKIQIAKAQARTLRRRLKSTGSLNLKPGYGCYTKYATCKKGNMTSMNITKNSFYHI